MLRVNGLFVLGPIKAAIGTLRCEGEAVCGSSIGFIVLAVDQSWKAEKAAWRTMTILTKMARVYPDPRVLASI